MAGIYHLNTMARDAYRSYILAYNSHSMKDIFNVHRLDLQVLSIIFYIIVISMVAELCVYPCLSHRQIQHRQVQRLNCFVGSCL